VRLAAGLPPPDSPSGLLQPGLSLPDPPSSGLPPPASRVHFPQGL